jgi:hypothetical protein
MPDLLPGLLETFKERLAGYFAQIGDAIRRNAHHDHRRALLIEFLRNTFGIDIDEIELELRVRAPEARGRVDAFYKYASVRTRCEN